MRPRRGPRFVASGMHVFLRPRRGRTFLMPPRLQTLNPAGVALARNIFCGINFCICAFRPIPSSALFWAGLRGRYGFDPFYHNNAAMRLAFLQFIHGGKNYERRCMQRLYRSPDLLFIPSLSTLHSSLFTLHFFLPLCNSVSGSFVT